MAGLPHAVRRYFWVPLIALLLAGVGLSGRSHADTSRPSGSSSVGSTGGSTVGSTGGSPAVHPLATRRWVSAWSASPEAASRKVLFNGGFSDETVRNILSPSTTGNIVRVQLDNTYGLQPLVVGRAAIGEAPHGTARLDQAVQPLSFHGRRSVVIPAGASAFSDPIHLSVRPFERLAVSVFLPGATGKPTAHGMAAQTNYVAPGDHVLDTAPSAFGLRTTSWYFVSQLDVHRTPGHLGTVVAFGDSITDGAHSRLGANARWPNDLARRLNAVAGPTLSVVDAGISGNRLLSASPCCGISGVARFGRDVLRQPSAREVIVLEGVNDLGAARYETVAQLIAGYRNLITQAHAAGLKIFGATLTPFRGARYWTPRGEHKRDLINAWIRHGGAFDGVVDFASAVADRHHPQQFNPRFDSGDHLHPNDAGYRAMARAVNLRMLLRDAK